MATINDTSAHHAAGETNFGGSAAQAGVGAGSAGAPGVLFESFAGFDINSIDLNWYDEHATDSGLETDGNYTFDGTTYPDAFYVQASDGYDYRELDFLGSGLTSGASGNITGGTVNVVGEFDINYGSELWFAEGMSVSAADIYNAAGTASNQDDIALFQTALAGNDTIILSSFDDRMSGYDGNDVIYGGGGQDILSGGAGNDVIEGGAGNDSFDGGDGVDTVTYENAGAGVTVTLSSTAAQDTVGAGIDTLTNVENLNGSSYADTLTGDSGPNSLAGEGGDDTLIGGPGDDTLNGGAGNDTASYASSSAAVTVDLTIAVAQDTVGAGSDKLVSIENLTGSRYDDHLAGNDAGNVLLGGAGADTLVGNGGDDTLNGGTGNDTLTGGLGNDTYYVDASGDTIVENSGGGTDTVLASASYELGANVENLTLTGTAALSATGNALANTITGNSAADVLYGNAGNDTLDGGAGADKMYGGLGNDVYVVDNASDAVYENAGEGTDSVTASVSYALRANVENLTLSGSADLTGKGNDLANVISGNSGNNALYGYGGDDRLVGGDGNDKLDGGTGTDRLYGGTGNDTYYVSDSTSYVYENAGEGTDAVVSAISYTLRANVENLSLSGTLSLTGRGNALDNVIKGNAGSNGLYGYDGNDHLYGYAGNDKLDGGLGVNHLYGGAGNDTYYVSDSTTYIYENAGEGTDRVYSSASLTLRANIEYLTLTGASAINGSGNDLANVITGNGADNVVHGNGGDDKLYAGAGNDTVSGDDGNDWIEGGAGKDVVYGGAGKDSFVFRDGDFAGATAATADIIRDFTHGDDHIRLNYADADTATAGDQAFSFLGTAAFDGHAGELRYEQIGGNTYVSGDSDGDGTANFMIRLDGLHDLVASDFVL